MFQVGLLELQLTFVDVARVALRAGDRDLVTCTDRLTVLIVLPAFLHLVSGISTANDRRNAQLAGNNGSVTSATTPVGNNCSGLLPWRRLGGPRVQPRVMMGSQSGSVMSATSTSPCENSLI